jgi:hypothetical protein
MLPTVCQAAMSAASSGRATAWFIIGLFGWRGWLVVGIIFIVWGTIELMFRNGTSANGCTWLFNVAVGSLTFTVFQSLTYLFFSKLFGDRVYCLPWPYPFHIAVFPSVWLFLWGIGLWVY